MLFMLYRYALVPLSITMLTLVNICYSKDEQDVEAVYPQIARSFGKIVKVEATVTFIKGSSKVKNSEDYYIITIESVDGNKLKQNVKMECYPFSTSLAQKMDFERIAKKNPEKIYTIIGYEIATMAGLPSGSIPAGVPSIQERAFHIDHHFIIYKID